MRSYYPNEKPGTWSVTPYSAESTLPDHWPEDRAGIGVHSLVQLWSRRKTILISVSLFVLTCTAAWIIISPRSYEAVVKIFVKRARIETLSGDRDTSAAQSTDVSESDIRSEIEILRSRDLLEGVAVGCGLAPPSAHPSSEGLLQVAAAARNLDENIKIKPITKTNIIVVSYRSRDPKRAAEILNTLTGLYLQKHTALHRSRETSQFFGDQQTRYRAELVKAQQKLSDFQQRYETSLLEQRKELNLKRIAELEAGLQQLNAEAQEATSQAELLASKRASLPEMIKSQSRTARNEILLERLKSQLLDLQNKRTELLSKFEPGYRLVTEVDQQIRDTSEAIRREEAPVLVDQTDTLNPLRESVETELSRIQSLSAGLAARKKSVMEELERSRQKQRMMEQLTGEYDDLERNKKVSEQNYLLYEKKTEEAHIADALDQHKFLNVSILEEAAAPVLPVAKHSGFILLLGTILAASCAAGSALLAESLDPLIRTPGELTVRTGLPVLALVSGGKYLSGNADGDELASFKWTRRRARSLRAERGGDEHETDILWELSTIDATPPPVPNPESEAESSPS
jgi:uncharacterized protein involved in exopolysaccharide biosynthesis